MKILPVAIAASIITIGSTWLADVSPDDSSHVPAIEHAHHDGAVVSAEAGTLTILEDSGQQHSHAIDSDVAITVNGKTGQLTDLKKGMRVRVTLDKDGKAMAVTTVDAPKVPRSALES
jgi:hypothetical protein